MIEPEFADASATGNSAFNLNDAVPLTEDDLAPRDTREELLDFQKVDEIILGTAKGRDTERASSAITPEDLAFEMQLQQMQQESVLPAERVEKLTTEIVQHDFMADAVENYQPAKTLNELEQQVFTAKAMGIDAIEASEEIIRYYNRTHYPSDVGYFIYKNIKVFIPGFFKTKHVNTDKQNVSARLLGLGK